MKRIFSALLILSVVTTPIAAPFAASVSPVGTASADHCPWEGIYAIEAYCEGHAEEIDDQQDHVSMYSTALGIYAQSQSFLDIVDNYLNDTQDTAWLYAEQAVARSYQNGSTEAEAKVAAKERVRDYYTIKQWNHANAWNNHVTSLNQLVNESKQLDGTTFGPTGKWNAPGWTVDFTGTGGYDRTADTTTDTTLTELTYHDTNTTLINGTTTTVKSVQMRFDGEIGTDSLWFVIRYDPYNGARVSDIGGEEHEGGPDTVNETGNINVQPPNDDYSTRGYIYPYQWNRGPDRMNSLQQEINGEIDTFVTNTYDDWQAGEINVTDLLSNVNLMNHYQLDAMGNDTEFNDAVAALAASGFSTSELENTSYMNLTYKPLFLSNQSITRQGMLLSGSAPPNETWQIGTEYNSHNLSGAQAVATIDGEIHTINGTFTINAVYDSDGNEIDDAEIVSPERDYKTTNTTALQQQIEELSKLYEELEERKSDSGGGGVNFDVPNPLAWLGSIGAAVQQWLFVLVLLFLAFAFLAVVS